MTSTVSKFSPTGWIDMHNGAFVSNLDGVRKLRVRPVIKWCCHPVDSSWDWEWGAYECDPWGFIVKTLAHGHAMTMEDARAAAERSLP